VTWCKSTADLCYREHWNHVRRMIELVPRSTSPIARFGGQPIAIAAVALAMVVLGIGFIALWRAYTGTAPETDRAVVVRQLQERTAQASDQLVEKTKGLEATQQESINQLQVVQDQLQTVRRLLASQQIDTKKLSELVGRLTEAIDGLRQSFASTRASEAAADLNGRPRQSPGRLRSTNRSRAKQRPNGDPGSGSRRAESTTPLTAEYVGRTAWC
jgi:uncharacterized protein YoxC